MKGLMSKLKNKKVISIGLIIILLIAIIVISFVLSNKNSEKDNQEQDNVVNTSTISLNYNVNEDCINYLEDLEVFQYEDLVNSDYSDTLYYTHSDEVYEYYLVCLTDLSVTIDEEETDLKEALDSELITLDELDSLLVQEKIDEYMVTPTIEETTTSEKDAADEEENDLEEETTSEEESTTSSSSSSNNSSSSSNNSSSSSSSSSNKSSSSSSSSSSNSSSSSSNSSSNSSSSSSSSSSKDQDNTTVKKYLASMGYQWDFNSQSEAEAWQSKILSLYRGFTVGWGSYQYGDSDEAYYGYVRVLASDDTCGNAVKHEVDWHSIGYTKYSVANYLYNLGYDCSGYYMYVDGVWTKI